MCVGNRNMFAVPCAERFGHWLEGYLEAELGECTCLRWWTREGRHDGGVVGDSRAING